MIMKKIIMIVVFVVMLSLISCTVSGNIEDTETRVVSENTDGITAGDSDVITEEETSSFPVFDDKLILDPDKKELPSYQDLMKITYDMTLDEVYAIAGLPQRIGWRQSDIIPDAKVVTYIYDSSDGISLEIAYKFMYSGDVLIKRIYKTNPEQSEE